MVKSRFVGPPAFLGRGEESVIPYLVNELFPFLEELFENIYGLDQSNDGILDSDNIPESVFTDFHDAIAGNHAELEQATDPGDATASIVEVTSADAGAVYNAAVQALINEQKADINTLVTDLNAAITILNSLLANQRTASQIA